MDTLLTEIMMFWELRESIQSEETQLLLQEYHELWPAQSQRLKKREPAGHRRERNKRRKEKIRTAVTDAFDYTLQATIRVSLLNE